MTELLCGRFLSHSQREAVSSARRERLAERFAHMRTMQARIVALLRAAGRNLEINENRPWRRQQRVDLLLEYLAVGEFMHRRIARRPGKAAKVHLVATRDRMAAVGLVGAILTHEVVQIGRCR